MASADSGTAVFNAVFLCSMYSQFEKKKYERHFRDLPNNQLVIFNTTLGKASCGLEIPRSLLMNSCGKIRSMIHSVSALTCKYAMAFLYSDWPYFLWHSINGDNLSCNVLSRFHHSYSCILVSSAHFSQPRKIKK